MLSIALQTQAQQLTYVFDLQSSSVTYMNNFLTTAKTNAEDSNSGSVFHFSGLLHIRLADSNALGQLYVAAIRQTQYESGNTASGNRYQPDTFFLSRPFYFTINNGNVTAVQLYNKMSDQVSGSIKTLLSLFQFSIPQDTSTHWTVVQDDPTGHCKTTFSLLKQDAGRDSLLKEKQVYVAYKNEVNSNRLKTTYLPSGDSRIVVDRSNNLPILIDGNEKIVTQLSDKTIGTIDNMYRFSRSADTLPSPFSNTSKPLLPNKKLYKTTGLYSFINSHDFDIMVRKGMLGKDNINTILAKLKRPIRKEDEDSLYLKIKSVITVHPATAVRLTAVLDTAKPGTLVYSHLYRGLIAAENKEAVNALSMLVWKHRNDWNYSKKILSNLGLTSIVTDTMIVVYKNLSALKNNERISKTAQMAIGTMVDNLSAADTSEGKKLWDWLQADLAAMPINDASARQKILVWGNTNIRTAFDSVVTYLQDSSEEIRSVATMATGQFSTPAKVPVLLKLIKSDTLMSIKNSAGTSIDNSVLVKEDVDLLLKLISEEKDSTMKNLLINAINPATPEKTVIRETLQKIIEQESSFTVKANIEAILKRLEEFSGLPANE